MTTAEAVIPSSDQHTKAYDLFGLVRGQPDFVASSDVLEPFRIRIIGLEGSSPMPGTSHCKDLEVEVALAAYGTTLTLPVQTAHSSVGGKIEEWVFFPMSYAELPLDAMVCITVRGPMGAVVGGCTFFAFTSRGGAKRGARRYALHAGQCGDPSEVTSTAGHTDTTAWQHLARDFRQSRMPSAPWLDALAMTRIRIIEAEGSKTTSVAVGTAQSASASATLLVAESFGASGSSASFSAATPSSFANPAPPVAAASGSDAAKVTTSEACADMMFIVVEFPGTSTGQPLLKTGYTRELAEARKKMASPWATDATPFCPFPDLGIGADNLCELKAVHLGKSTNAVYDPAAKPSLQQRRQLQDLLQIQPISLNGEPLLTAEQSALLWGFRHYVAANDSQLFCAMMSAVDWTNAQEEAEATALLPLWKNVALSDALAMLSTSVRPLRTFALQVLSKHSNSAVVLLLLQLVQAMRFDTDDNELFSHLLERATQCWRLCSFMFWYLCVEADLEDRQKGGQPAVSKATQAGQSSTTVGFVKVSRETYQERRLAMLAHLNQFRDEFKQRLEAQQQLRTVLTALYSAARADSSRDRGKMAQLTSAAISEGKYGIKDLFAQDVVVYLPSHPHLAIRGISDKGVYFFKSAKMPVKLEFIVADTTPQNGGHDDDDTSTTVANFGTATAGSPSGGSVATLTTGDLGTEPSGIIDALDSAAAMGSTEPCTAQDLQQQQQQAVVGSRSPAAPAMVPIPAAPEAAAPNETIALMFKCGDDVRQDQLVIQFIELMDQLLKQNGLNLHLTPYRALATSQQDGFVEMVLGCETFQNVQQESVLKFLRRLNPAQGDFDRAVDRFVKSTAGYCVVTFLLGIGDRHLENLLITKDGRLFHVDFGFILGKDPKPFPPPMKLNSDMVEAMGGANGKQYRNFRAYCCSAFNTLRKSSHLLLNLLLLMSDANIPNLDDDGKVDPRVNIARVQEKLRLDLNDAEASHYFNGVINDSLGARLTNLWDFVHKKAQDVRN